MKPELRKVDVMSDRNGAATRKDIRDRHIVSDKTTEVLVNDVVRKIMKDHPEMCTGDAAVGMLNAAVYVVSRLPGVDWEDVSGFLKSISEVIDNSTDAEIEAHYRSSQPLN